jgi:NhaA family Na+:H+ antiporter
VDDIGAVIVIGIFYTEAVYFLPLIFSMFILIFMVLGNRLGIRTPWFYLALGIILWIAFLKSGIHATVAGVLSALTIPARSLVDSNQFVIEGKSLLEIFSRGITKKQETKNKYDLLTTEQESVVGTLETACEFVLPPLVRLEHGILPWVTFFIMPIFALANAGVVIEGNIFNTVSNTVSLGVICGLLFGKPLGILLFSLFAVKLGISKLPENSTWLQILGIGFFAGIGFTMSIFVASLAFAENPGVLIHAKIGILLGSILSAIMGLILLLLGKKSTNRT